jgi:threonine dehydrogenase-like Zn-dependent dehydrogenase
MRAIVMEGPKKSKVVEVPTPTPAAGELLVKVIYTGMCQSEYYPWSVAKEGQRFGHEPIGIVAQLGENVEGFKLGDRVTGNCNSSAYSEYCIMKQEFAVHVPENISDEDAVGEPLGCLLSAASRMPIVTPGDSVAIVGAGYMGLGMVSLFKLKGAGKIVVVDPREEARENALRFGATEVYSPENLPSEYLLNWDNWGKVDMFKTGFSTVMEFAGTESGLRLAGEMVCAHGLLGIGGYHNDGERRVDFKLWNVKAIVANSLHERRTAYQSYCCKNAIDLISKGLWDFKGVTNNIYTMEEFDMANEVLETKPKGYIKALIKMN